MTTLYFDPGIAPNDVLDYEFDWSDWLSSGDTIVSATVTGSPSLTVSSALVSGSLVVVWVSGAVVNTSYRLTCEITTTQGRTVNRSGILNCKAL